MKAKTKKELPNKFPVTGYRVVIRELPVEVKTKSGIILETPKETQRRQAAQVWAVLEAKGDVAFTGPDYGKNDRDLYPNGSTVLMRVYAGTGFSTKHGDKDAPKYRICADSDILMPLPEGMELYLID